MAITFRITCDFCGSVYGIATQQVEAGDSPMLNLNRPVIFGRDACESCVVRAREAVHLSLTPDAIPAVRIS